MAAPSLVFFRSPTLNIFWEVRKKIKKNLVVQKKCITFASANKKRAFSSAGLEHLPYKQRVGGSNPSTPTKTRENPQLESCGFKFAEKSSLLEKWI